MPAAEPTSAAPIDDTPTTVRAVDPIAPVAAADARPPKVPVNRETLRQAARLFGYLLPYRAASSPRWPRCSARPAWASAFPTSSAASSTSPRAPPARLRRGRRAGCRRPAAAGGPARGCGVRRGCGAWGSTASSRCSIVQLTHPVGVHLPAGDLVQRGRREGARADPPRHLRAAHRSAHDLLLPPPRGRTLQPHLRRPDPDRGHPHRRDPPVPAPEHAAARRHRLHRLHQRAA